MSIETSDDGDGQEYSHPRVQPYKQERRLRRLYCERGFTQSQIADRFNISQGTVSKWLSRYGLNTVDSEGNIEAAVSHTDDVENSEGK